MDLSGLDQMMQGLQDAGLDPASFGPMDYTLPKPVLQQFHTKLLDYIAPIVESIASYSNPRRDRRNTWLGPGLAGLAHAYSGFRGRQAEQVKQANTAELARTGHAAALGASEALGNRKTYAKAIRAQTVGGVLKTPEEIRAQKVTNAATKTKALATAAREGTNVANAAAGVPLVGAPRPRRSTGLLDTPDKVTNFTPGALYNAAVMYSVTGKLPGLGIGGQAGEDKKKIMNAQAELFPGVNIATNSATFGADSKSLAKMQSMYDNATAFEQTALKNVGVLEKTFVNLKDSGSPLLNRPLRSFGKDVLGDSGMAEFDAALETVQPEFARILSSPTMAGQLTDQARKEMQLVMDRNATIPQIMRSLKVLRTDAHNRREAYSAGLDTIRERISGHGQTPDSVAPVVARWGRDANGNPVRLP
jgi:hypothetical protein